MASIRQRESGFWQAIVRRKGQPDQSKTFARKMDAELWAKTIESEIGRGVFVSRSGSESTTFSDAADRYSREVLPAKRGAVQDGYRIKALIERFGDYSLATISTSMLAAYRDERLKVVSAQSVVHDLNMVSRIFKTAVLDWGIALPGGIPTAMVRKPSVNNERSRRLVGDEEHRLLAAINTPPPGRRSNPFLGVVVRFALETAARQSEILSLDWKDVDISRRVVRLRGVGGRSTKNEDVYRDVPLSTTAAAILEGLAGNRDGKVIQIKRGKVFATTASAIKQSWERAVVRARDRYEREYLLAGLLATGIDEGEAQLEIRKVKRSNGRVPAKVKPPRKETLRLTKELEDDPLLTDLHFHDLRHEATSRLADKLQMHELMKVTGHKGTRMLARYYHPRAEDLARKLG